MSIFAGLEDLEDIEEVTFENNKPGRYEGIVESVEWQNGTRNNPDTLYMVFRFKLQGCPSVQMEYKSYPDKPLSSYDNEVQDSNGHTPRDRAMRAMGYVKARLKSIGVPENRINSVTFEELAGLPVVVVLKEGRNNYINVHSVEPLSAKSPVPATASPTGEMPAGGSRSSSSEFDDFV